MLSPRLFKENRPLPLNRLVLGLVATFTVDFISVAVFVVCVVVGTNLGRMVVGSNFNETCVVRADSCATVVVLAVVVVVLVVLESVGIASNKGFLDFLGIHFRTGFSVVLYELRYLDVATVPTLEPVVVDVEYREEGLNGFTRSMDPNPVGPVALYSRVLIFFV